MEAANLKRQGVKAGVPDLCLPVPKNGYHGLYIEMKYGRNKTTQKQEEWLKALQEQGYYVAVCYGAEEAERLIASYLNMAGYPALEQEGKKSESSIAALDMDIKRISECTEKYLNELSEFH